MPNAILSLIIGILGFLTAIITNIDKISDFWNSTFTQTDHQITGEWNGVFREFWVQDGKEHVSSSRLKLISKLGNVTGTEMTTNGKPRDWKLTGQNTTLADRHFLIITYTSTNDNRPSVGSIVFEYAKDKNSFVGYQIGLDPDQNRFTSYPYVLTKLDPVEAEKNFSDHLNSTIPSYQKPIMPK